MFTNIHDVLQSGLDLLPIYFLIKFHQLLLGPIEMDGMAVPQKFQTSSYSK